MKSLAEALVDKEGMDNSSKVILDLCSGERGNWSSPYQENGYTVFLIDVIHGFDARLFKKPDYPVYGILAAPPCTHTSYSGARWWAEKGEAALLEALSIADACIRLVMFTKPVFWCLENPAGRLQDYYGDPVIKFNPYDFGDNYTKETWLWGEFNIPTPVALINGAIDKKRIHYMAKSEKRGSLRSITPSGFARAFYEANK